MLIDTAPVEQAPGTERIRTLELIVTMGIATVVAPVAAPMSVMFVLGLAHSGVEGGLLWLLIGPFMLLTIPGMYLYVAAFFAVAVLGTGLTLLALGCPRLRPKWIWTAVGALFGTLIATRFAPVEPLTLACGAAAGGSCAFLYRLIVAGPLAACRTGNGALD